MKAAARSPSRARTPTGGTTIGSGVVALSGAGTLGATTGTLNVSGGVLDLGGTTQTTGAMVMTGGSILNGVLNSAADGNGVSYDVSSGVIQAQLMGAGNLQKDGTGTLTLTGANLYGGITQINQGALVVGNNLALSTSVVHMADGTTLGFTHGGFNLANNFVLDDAVGQGASIDTGVGTETLSGQISGTDRLIKLGTGTLVLTGTNNYSGGTTISAGTLQIGSGGAAGSITGAVLDNGRSLSTAAIPCPSPARSPAPAA